MEEGASCRHASVSMKSGTRSMSDPQARCSESHWGNHAKKLVDLGAQNDMYSLSLRPLPVEVKRPPRRNSEIRAGHHGADFFDLGIRKPLHATRLMAERRCKRAGRPFGSASVDPLFSLAAFRH
jgi:hypothetical protein